MGHANASSLIGPGEPANATEDDKAHATGWPQPRRTPSGIERYRPLEGAAAGPETEVRERPGIVALTFEIPDDQHVLDRVIETIFQVHSYQEPAIKVQPVLVARSKGLDDSDNPHRWWNTTGDWKKKQG